MLLGLTHFYFNSSDTLPQAAPAAETTIISSKIKSEELLPVTDSAKQPFNNDLQVISDPQQSYQQGRQLRGCHRVPEDDDALSAWVDEEMKYDAPQFYIDEMLQRFERCRGVPRSYEFVELFIRAAESGSEEALSALMSVSDINYFAYKGIGQHQREEMIKARKELKQLKFGLAQKQMRQGSEKAMMLVLRSYQGDGHSIVKLYSLTEVIKQVSNNNEFYNYAVFLQTALYEDLTPQQIDEALAWASAELELIAQ